MTNETYAIKAKNPKTGEEKEYTTIHDKDWNNRLGYEPNFLGIELPLPSVQSYNGKTALAINIHRSRNGHYAIDYSNFSIAFDTSKKLPVFTAVNINGTTNILGMVHEERGSDRWFIDGRLKKGEDHFQYTNDDYRASGLQKGHMVRFYDPAWSKSDEINAIAIGDTFHYTNACPQVAKYNAGVWNDLEDYYMARAIFKDKKVTVFSGPIFNGAKKLNGLLVPMSFWKILVYNNGKNLEAMGFLITHKVVVEEMMKAQLIVEEKLVEPKLKEEYIKRLYEKKLKAWKIKVSVIEEKTGLNFGLNTADVFSDKDDSMYFEKLVSPVHLSEEKIVEIKDKFLVSSEEKSADRVLISSL